MAQPATPAPMIPIVSCLFDGGGGLNQGARYCDLLLPLNTPFKVPSLPEKAFFLRDKNPPQLAYIGFSHHRKLILDVRWIY